MIIVNIKNGLGNQMFQYAFGRVLEWKYNIKVEFDLMREDLSTPLKSNLDVFDIPCIKETKPQNVIPFKPFSVRQFRDNKQYLLYLYFKFRRKFQSHKLITEPYPSQYMRVFDKLQLSDNYYFLGFWQNYRYFEGYEKQICQLFKPKDQYVFESDIALDIIHSKFDTISLHFRRGDYINSGFIEPTSIDYYYQAIEIMKSKFKNPYLYIFTDDPDWVKLEFLIDLPYTVVSGNIGANCYKDILLMSICQHNIMANSSFSWWGAYLNENPSKIVIAPKKWYAILKRDKFTSEITLPSWNRL